jgi:hypothetical protein
MDFDRGHQLHFAERSKMKIPESVINDAKNAAYGEAKKYLEPFLIAQRRRAIMGNKTKFKIAARKKRKR